METLTGLQTIDVVFEDGKSSSVVISQLPLRSYEKAFIAMDDEIALTAIICGMERAAMLQMKPDSYEKVRKAAVEINESGFFAFARRRQEAVMTRLNNVKPELLQLVSEKLSQPSQQGLLPK